MKKLILFSLLAMFMFTSCSYSIANVDGLVSEIVKTASVYKTVLIKSQSMPDSVRNHYIDSFLLHEKQTAYEIKGALEAKEDIFTRLPQSKEAIEHYLAY